MGSEGPRSWGRALEDGFSVGKHARYQDALVVSWPILVTNIRRSENKSLVLNKVLGLPSPDALLHGRLLLESRSGPADT